MISFEVGSQDSAIQLLNSLTLFVTAESLGAVESLAEHPGLMTHASIPEEVRMLHGIGDGLIRLSIGIEDESDLRDDLRNALSSLTAR